MQYNDAVACLTMRPLLVGALLVTVTVTIYAPALRGTFQYDDFSTILLNPHLNGWEPFIGHLDHMVRPVLYATFLVDRSLFGNNPSGYHVLNLLLHLASGLLLYRILTRTVAEDTRAVPFWTALLFLIHPLQTETVTYISGRSSGLMACFVLLALFLYLKSIACAEDRVSSRWYLFGSVASFALSLASKETAFVFPFILLLWDRLIRRLSGAQLRTVFLSSHLPFWIILLLAAAWAWHHPRYVALAHFSRNLRPVWDNLLSQAHAAIYALWLFVSPWKQNFDHDLPEFHSLFQWPLPLDLLILVGIATATLIAVRRNPLVAFGVGWFFLQLLPTALIPRADLLSERNLYLASIGLLLAIVVLCARLIQRLMTVLPYPRVARFGACSLALVLAFILGGFTHERTRLYQDEVSLWSDTVGKSPNKARPHNNLGHAYAMQDDWDRAIDEFRTAVRLDPDYGLAQRNLRDAYLHHVGRQ